MARTLSFALLVICALANGCGGGGTPNYAPSVPVVSSSSSETLVPGPPNSWSFDFVWSASTDANGDPIQYYAEVYQLNQFAAPPTFPFDFANDGTLYVDSGWIDTLSWSITGAPTTYHYVFRVKARDSGGAESGWGVWENNMLGSCPFVFSWDGEKYAFESDIFPSGRLGTRGSQGYLQPHPLDYYVMTTTPALKDGAYEIQVTGERAEVDYLDEIQLLAIYHSESTSVFTQRPPLGVDFFPGIERLHTVKMPLASPVTVTHVNTGADVTSTVAAMDDVYLTLNEDPNVGYDYQTLELDLGDLSAANRVKLIIDAQTVYFSTAEGAERRTLFGPSTKIEVPDAQGAWTRVPTDVVRMTSPAAFRRPVVLDVTDAFVTNDFRIRLTWLFKTFVDAVLLDTSEDEPITVVPLQLQSADLHYRGFSARTAGERYELLYDKISARVAEYFPGAYTKYGDVLELLTDSDDRFVVFYGGDEMTLRFAPAPAPETGQLRGFVVMSNGYYKDPAIDLPATVAPLPFAGMSNYPYGPEESYPDDPLHQDYLDTWNTRIHPE